VIDTLPHEKREVRHLVVASDNSHVALCYDDGLLWMGNLEEEKVLHLVFTRNIAFLVW
jgi:hypothetical protein